MDPSDPRLRFNINNFDAVDLNDSPRWGRAIDLRTLNDKYGGNTKFLESISNMKLSSHATSPVDWTITAVRNWQPQDGTAYNAPMAVDLNMFIGGGNALATNELYGADLPPGYSTASASVFGQIPLHGISFHVVSETCIVNVTGRTYGSGPAFWPKTDQLIAWISRGRPTVYYVTKILYYDQTTPNQIPITIPAFAVSCSIATFDMTGAPTGQPRINSTIRFCRDIPPVPSPVPAGYQFQIPATENNNDIIIPWDSYTIYDAGGGAQRRQTMIKFKCVS